MAVGLSEARAIDILSSELRATYGGRVARGVLVGIGDDAAALRAEKRATVWSTDACCEGSHFLRGWLSAEDIAHKSLHAAVSDIAAMGAEAQSALCHLTLPPWASSAWLRRFAAAQAQVCRDAQVALVGGNVTFLDRLQIVTSVQGCAQPHQLLRRSGAQPGHEVWLAGQVGKARAGLLLLQAGRGRTRSPALVECLAAFRRPRAQQIIGKRLAGRASSCMDLSDGLRSDSAKLAHQSGVALRINRAALAQTLAPALAAAARALSTSAWELAWIGGEDYGLLATGPSAQRPRGVQVIGEVTRGQGVSLCG